MERRRRIPHEELAILFIKEQDRKTIPKFIVEYFKAKLIPN